MVESLELDSFGISLIPSSLVGYGPSFCGDSVALLLDNIILSVRSHNQTKFPNIITYMRNLLFVIQVSTYALLVDDVVEVFTDTVVVRDAAVSRLQRLTKVSLLLVFVHILSQIKLILIFPQSLHC